MDSIDSREGFLCNANAEQTFPHNDYALSLFIEDELCERRRGCTHACTTLNYTENRYHRIPQKPNYKRHPFMIGKRCTCGSMYKPAMSHIKSEDRDAAHEKAAQEEIEAIRNEFEHQFVMAPFSWNTHENGKQPH